MLPRLYKEDILLSMIDDILFTVVDDKSNLFIASQHYSSSDYVEYIVSPCFKSLIDDMLHCTISVREVFLHGSFIATLRLNSDLSWTSRYWICSNLDFNKLPRYVDNILPTKDMYWNT